MKTFYSCIIALFVLASCSQDFSTTPPLEDFKDSFREQLTSPSNATNPYDSAGSLQDEILDSYFSGSNLPTNISGIVARVETIANGNSVFLSLKPTTYVAANSSRISYLLAHPSTCVSEVVTATSMSTTAKTSLIAFINTVVTMCATTCAYEDIYDYVIAYEATVINSTTLTASEKQVILITSSIARYTSYRKKKKSTKNTDPEWALLVGHISAGTDRSMNSICEAVTMSASAGVAENVL